MGTKHKVLVIDDDQSITHLLAKWLTADGYDVVEAHTGNLGFFHALQDQPSLILLDIMIPDMSGGELAKKLAEDESTKDIPIIFMTNCMDIEQDKGMSQIVVNELQYRAFAKPLHNRKLLSVIRKVINSVENNNI